MNIASRDNATPVFLLRNCAGHLSGSLRTLGAVAVGQLGRSSNRFYFGKEGLCMLELWGWETRWSVLGRSREEGQS